MKSRTDLTDKEKEDIVSNAYNIVSQNGGDIPGWVTKHCLMNITWDDNTSIQETTSEVEQYFQFT